METLSSPFPYAFFLSCRCRPARYRTVYGCRVMAEAGKFGYACRFASTAGGIYAKLQSNAADTKVNRIRQQVKEQCSRTSSSEKDL